jgi:imidazolonepropionase-like amidohydrolase
VSTGQVTALVGGRVLPVDGPPLDPGVVLLEGSRIAAVGGPNLAVPDTATVIDVAGRHVLPGFVDAHTHLGVHEEAEGWAGQDTNEMTDPVTAQVRALDAVNPADLGFRDAVAGGVLAAGVNPGSGNPIGGQTVALRCWGRSVDEMVLRQPCGVKSALGENPKRVYGDQKKTPSTRLGTAAIIRGAFTDARNYLARREHPEPGKPPPDVDLKLEVLGRVLRREIPWRQHSHRADDIATAVRLADEFGYRLVIDHGTEARLLADVLAARRIPVLIGPLLTSRSKVELRNRTLRSPAALAAAGVEISIITDHPVVPIDFLVHQATFAVREGLDPQAALRAITINPARVLGIDDRLGSLTPGKDADLTVWSGDPLDVMSRVERAFVLGTEVYRFDAERRVGTVADPGFDWRPPGER